MIKSFWRVAAADPGRVALVDEDGAAVTAGELLSGANRWTHGLRALGVARGAVVAAFPSSDRGRAFLELALGALQAGVTLVPLSPRLTGGEVEGILAAAGARLLDAVPAGQPDGEPAERALGALAFAGSGTTGAPRVVVRPLVDRDVDRACAAEARLRLGAVGLGSDEPAVHAVVSPLYHSAALGWALAHLHAGHRVVLVAGATAETFLATVASQRVTGAFLVPTHFVRLLALPDDVRAAYDLSSLRHVVHGGAPCPVEVKRRMLAWWGPVIHEVYGAAEATVGTHVGPEDWLAHPGTVGRLGRQGQILRDDGSPCAPGEIGAVVFRDGAAPGDFGHVDAEGYLYLADRRTDLILSGGVNLYPSEIEAALLLHPAVLDAAVVGVAHPEWGQEVRAVVELRPGARASDELAAALMAHCRVRLAGYKCPRRVVFVAELPRDALGKLQRRRLREGGA